MAFTPVNELERLLVAASTDPAARPAFYKAILDHNLFVITEGQKPDGSRQFLADENTTISVRNLEVGGKPHIPIFSSVERISAVVSNEVGYIATRGETVFSMFRGSDLILNPGADYGKIFTAAEVNSILDGSILHASASLDVGGKRILLGQPSHYPHHIVEPLCRFFSQVPQVQAAYLAHAMIPEMDQEAHTLIGLKVSGNYQKVVAEAGLVVNGASKPGEIVDFVELSKEKSGTINTYLLKNTRPFYARRKWLGLL